MKALWPLVLLLAGCCPQKYTLSKVDAAWRLIEPKYRMYVQADPKLDEGSKAIRLATCELMNKAIEEAR